MTTPSDTRRDVARGPSPRLRGSLWSLAVIVALVWGGSLALNWWRNDRATRTLQSLARPGDILMLTTATCPYCAKARAWMSARSVPWQECDVERDERCARVYQAQGTPGVPLMNVKGQWRLGFDPLWVSDAIAAP
jgi:glutaredoxin